MHRSSHSFIKFEASNKQRCLRRLVERPDMEAFRLSKYIFRGQQQLGTVLAFSIMASNGSALCGHSSSTRFDYTPPTWAADSFNNVPEHGRLKLGNLPTPLYKLTGNAQCHHHIEQETSIIKRLEDMDITLYIKRDDMTGGVETGGNKIRKLEFLLADALARSYNSVVTIGGEQSNHCRATASAARMAGLEPHLILRTKRADEIREEPNDIGFTGNILFDRMVGSTIYTCSPGEYGRIGSQEMVARLCAHLKDTRDNCNPYPIPVGGSNSIGTWGYINGVDELVAQWNSIDSNPSLDHVVFACGSGGTAAGIGLGIGLAYKDSSDTPPQVHAIGVCDSPDYFYGHVSEIAREMDLQVPEGTPIETFVRDTMIVHQGKGQGYAVSTPEELEFITNFAIETGIVLDPVYSGKALYNFFKDILQTEGEQYRGKSILFWHTGGALGLYEQGNMLNFKSPAKRLDFYGKGYENGVDISRPPEE
jgi:D-cysteine desulfhydrase